MSIRKQLDEISSLLTLLTNNRVIENKITVIMEVPEKFVDEYILQDILL